MSSAQHAGLASPSSSNSKGKRKPPPSVHSEDLRPVKKRSSHSLSQPGAAGHLPRTQEKENIPTPTQQRPPLPAINLNRDLPPLPPTPSSQAGERLPAKASRLTVASNPLTERKAVAPASSLSQVLCAPSTSLSLSATFPSLITVTSSLRSHASQPQPDVAVFQSLAKCFDNVSRNLFCAMSELPEFICVDEAYEVGRQSSEMMCRVFAHHVASFHPDSGVDQAEFVGYALDLMEMAINNLQTFVDRADGLLSEAERPVPSTNPMLRPGTASPGSASVKSARRRTLVDFIKEKPAKDGKQPHSNDHLLDLLTSVMGIRANVIKLRDAKAAQVPDCVNPDEMSFAMKDLLLKRLLVRSVESRKKLAGQEDTASLLGETFIGSTSGSDQDSMITGETATLNSVSTSTSRSVHFAPSEVSNDITDSGYASSTKGSLAGRITNELLIRRLTTGKLKKLSKFTQLSKAGVTPPIPERPCLLRPYVVRDSALIHPDPSNPELTVTMPRPSGEAWNIHVDSNGIIRRASLPALIRFITSDEGVRDPDLTDTVFRFFRLFSSPLQIFSRLVSRFTETPEGLDLAQLRVWNLEASRVRLRVMVAFLKWIKEYWDPSTDVVIVIPLLDFLFTHIKDGDLAAVHAWGILDALCAFEVQGETYQPDCVRQRVAQLGRMRCDVAHEPSQFRHLDSRASTAALAVAIRGPGGPAELARQLTLLTSKQFMKIEPDEAVLFWWKQGSKGSKGKMPKTNESGVAQEVTKLGQLQERINIWVQHEVLDRKTKEERAEELSFWLTVAEKCMEIRSFCVAFCIYSSVLSAAVYRLKATIANIPTESREVFLQLQNTFSDANNYHNYRYALQKNNGPAVPLLGFLAHDMFVAKEGASLQTKDDSSLINLAIYRTMWHTLRSMDYGRVPYSIRRFEPLQGWIAQQLDKFDPNQYDKLSKTLYERSVAAEPRNTTITDDWAWKHGTSQDPQRVPLSQATGTPKENGTSGPSRIALRDLLMRLRFTA